MRIAQVAPLYESVPPKRYGGTERIVSYLTEEFVRQGHDVTLFASGDSMTAARLVAPCRRALRLDGQSRDPLVHHVLLLETVLKYAETFDIIHFHCDYLHFPISRRWVTPHVTTLHGRLDAPELSAFLGDAHALLFPIDWPEPFGLVMVEAMACGTPVIATRRGSVPEVIDDGVTGFVIDGVEDAVKAVHRVPALDRRRCRQVFEERFTVGRMARDYLTLYERLLEGEREAAVGG